MSMCMRGILLAVLVLGTASPVWAMAKRPPVPAENQTPKEKIVLTFEKVYELALRRSEVIAMKREEIEKTKASWLKSAGEAIGDGDFVITDFLQDRQRGNSEGGVGGTFSAAERRERKFVFSQPLFQGFKTVAAVAGAGSLRKQRLAEHERSKELLFLETADAFYSWMQQKKDVETIEGIHQLFEERVRELKEREGVGRSRASEVATARAKMKILEAQLAQSRGALAIASSLMEFYTGLPSEDVIYEEQKLPPAKPLDPADYPLLLKTRPDVEAARQAAKTARQSIVAAQSELWPKISLDGNHYEHREGFQSGTTWDVLLKINVPLYRGGATLGDIKETYSEWQQAKLNYSLVKRQAELEIKEAHQNWIASQEQNKAFRQAVKAAQENYRLQKEDYTRSLVNNLDVLSALEELFNTSKEANRVHYEMKKYYWEYQTAAGACCSVITPSMESVTAS